MIVLQGRHYHKKGKSQARPRLILVGALILLCIFIVILLCCLHSCSQLNDLDSATATLQETAQELDSQEETTTGTNNPEEQESQGAASQVQTIDAADGGLDAGDLNSSVQPAQSQLFSAMQQAKIAVEGLVVAYGTNVAVVVKPLDGSEGFSINGNEQFVSASMIKLLVLVQYLEEVDSGQLDSRQTYTRNTADVVGGTGQIQNDAAGTTYTLDTLARYRIKYSDNTATNILIDKMGMNTIQLLAGRLGLTKTALQRKMMQSSSGKENYTSAQDIATLLYGIVKGGYASSSLTARAKEFLLEQTDNNGLAQGLPSGVSFAHKTGTLASARHDGGVVFSDNPYIIVVLTKSLGENTANTLMTQISKTVYHALG